MEPEPPKIELYEAPIPAVNIWQQRKQALSARVATSSLSEKDGSAAITQAVEPQKPAKSVEPIVSNSPGANGTKSQKKTADIHRPERNGSRAHRDAKNEAKTANPPPVEDAAAWPTPKIAIHEEKKKLPSDKPERSDKDQESDDGQAKPKQKKGWVTYDYVPTVNFETQLPQLRGSKSRGGHRSANGPRSTGTVQGGSDKPASAPATSKPGETKDKPREGVNGAGEITLNASTTGKRVSGDATSLRDQKKPGPSANIENPKEMPSHSITVSSGYCYSPGSHLETRLSMTILHG